MRIRENPYSGMFYALYVSTIRTDYLGLPWKVVAFTEIEFYKIELNSPKNSSEQMFERYI